MQFQTKMAKNNASDLIEQTISLLRQAVAAILFCCVFQKKEKIRKIIVLILKFSASFYKIVLLKKSVLIDSINSYLVDSMNDSMNDYLSDSMNDSMNN